MSAAGKRSHLFPARFSLSPRGIPALPTDLTFAVKKRSTSLGELKPKKFVLDGEIVVPADGAFSFDALLQRIHPAPSRISKLAAETPVLLIVFDLLVDAAGELLIKKTLDERRRALAAWRQN
jgi:ATP-dependent DNA ligase